MQLLLDWSTGVKNGFEIMYTASAMPVISIGTPDPFM